MKFVFNIFSYNVNYYVWVILILNSGLIYGQINKLSDLVQGERIFSSVLYNSKEEVVGYVYVYSHENPDPITRELEYVMLDQNLNLAFRKVINYPN
ncbi:MAG: hypothetical protein IPL25_12030 [Saprospiraceae bacterium]|nr:hypothetical protein [Candidatus Vicinibacter affinis]